MPKRTLLKYVWCPLNFALVLTASALAGETAPPPKATEAAAFATEDEAAILKQIQEQTPRDKALEKAVSFLLTQQKQDGAFGDKYPTAMTGLAIMALMAVGHTPDDPDPKYGPAIRRGLVYVLSQMRDDGYLGHNDNSRMYGHGMCTLMLSEAAGMTRDEVLERRLIEASKRAVKLILNAQAIRKGGDMQGGWRYEPNSQDSDLSLTGWQTMALRSAKNIGIDVPNTAIQAAITYIRANAAPDGGFAYQGKADHPVLRGIGLLALPVCGVYDAPELAKSTAKMLADPPRWQGPWFYYRVYYASVGMYQMGDQAAVGPSRPAIPNSPTTRRPRSTRPPWPPWRSPSIITCCRSISAEPHPVRWLERISRDTPWR
jgi:hypothetical protein